jgi:hypothetical protein
MLGTYSTSIPHPRLDLCVASFSVDQVDFLAGRITLDAYSRNEWRTAPGAASGFDRAGVESLSW